MMGCIKCWGLHTSIGIGDAIKAITTPVVEVHISNTFSRESFRHQSYISPNSKGIIIGFVKSYDLGLQSFCRRTYNKVLEYISI